MFSLINTWFAEVDVAEFERPAPSPEFNPTEHQWVELECWLHQTFILNVLEYSVISLMYLGLNGKSPEALSKI